VSRELSLLVAMAVAGCGPAIPRDVQDGQDGSGTPNLGPGDESIDVGSVAITGQIFEPLVLETYGVGGMTSSKQAATLDGQRKRFADDRDPLQKQADATYLATMLYAEAGNQPERRSDLLHEARQALADAVAAANDKADELTLELLARYSLLVGDLAAADRTWEMLVTRYPGNKDVDVFRAWWVYTRLAQSRNAEAAALLANAAIDKTPELGYMTAWVRWRSGDRRGTWQAIRHVVEQWSDPAATADNPYRLSVLVPETLRFAARTGASLDDTAAVIATAIGKQPGDAYDMWKQIGVAMRLAGRSADAIAADDKALAVTSAPASEAVAILLEDAQLAARLDAPDAVANKATRAVAAITRCGSACSAEDVDRAFTRIGNTAMFLHSIYTSANDDRYYEPARTLYRLSADKVSDRALHDELGNDLVHLELSHQALKPHTGRLGKHVKDVIIDHNQEVEACYEAALAANDKLAGTIDVTIQIEERGVVHDASAVPAADAAALSALAGCLGGAIRSWKFPVRGSEGSTQAKIEYGFRIEAPMAPGSR
jgi:tetratricopeptide (TPR) repeat protein